MHKFWPLSFLGRLFLRFYLWQKTLGNKLLTAGFLLWVILAVSTGCADREHANPLDPLNPKTHGQPPRLTAVSDHHKVFLTWPKTQLTSISGFAVYRWTDSSKVKKMATLPAEQTSVVDSQTAYGTRYFYAYSILAFNYESLRSSAESITPGPAFFWVSYRSSGQILKLTFDIQHPYNWMSGFAFPSQIVVAAPGKGVWMADQYLGELTRLSENGEFLFRIRGFGRISSFQLDRHRGVLWVADAKNRQVVHLDTTGRGDFAIRQLGYPKQVLVNEESGGCWILDSEKKQILFADPVGHLATLPTHFQAPRWMALDAEEDGIWVADSSRIVHVNLSGLETRSFSLFKNAYFVAVDMARARLWILDQSYLWFGTEVVVLKTNGETVFRKRGFEAPHNLVVDPFDGSAVIADTYNVRLVKMSSNGEELAIWETDAAPWWVSLEE